MARRAPIALALVALAASAAAASCSLGLDESLIDRKPDAGPDTTPLDDGGALDANDGAPPPITPEAGVCAKDEDCTTTLGCLKARCDVPRKACVFDVCRSMACSSSTCDTNTQTCGAGKPYPYRAAQFPVGAGVGCGGAIGRCFAAVYPYVFVGTPNGAVAFRATDPASATPAQVPITGLGFVPTSIVASGSRVYFLGGASGTGASSRLEIAWVDVPVDPFGVKVPAATVLPTLNRPPEGWLLYPRANDTALLLDTNAAASYPSVALEPPITEPATLDATPIPFTAGTSPVAVSGTRLLMYQQGPNGAPSFGTISDAGGAAPKNDGTAALANVGFVAGASYFASSPSGAVAWSTPVLTAPLGTPPPPPVQTRAARVFFLVGDGNAAPSAAAGVDVEVYPSVGAGASVAGPVAMLDDATAIVTAASAQNTSQTSVQFVTKTPLGVVKNGDGSPRRAILATPVASTAVAASHGLGYVLVSESPTAASVYVFDPGCAP